VGFVDKWPSKIEGQWFIEVEQAGGHQFSIEFINFGFFGRAADPTRIYLPKKSFWREFYVPLCVGPLRLVVRI